MKGYQVLSVVADSISIAISFTKSNILCKLMIGLTSSASEESLERS